MDLVARVSDSIFDNPSACIAGNACRAPTSHARYHGIDEFGQYMFHGQCHAMFEQYWPTLRLLFMYAEGGELFVNVFVTASTTFAAGRFENEINEDNPLGMGGEMARTFGGISCEVYFLTWQRLTKRCFQ